MKKKTLQVTLSFFMLFAFIYSSVMLYRFFEQMVFLYMSGKLEMTLSVMATLLIYGVFLAVQFLFLASAIQIYRRDSYALLRWLLYASIPHFNCFGYVSYMFVFGPFLAFTAGATFEPMQFFVDSGADYFDVQYMLTFSRQAQPVFQIGLNVVPILLLMTINGTFQRTLSALRSNFKRPSYSAYR